MTTDLMNRIHNSSNPFQGKFRRTLTVCSAGLLRSPSTAFVLSLPPYNRNVRACGSYPNFALVPIDEALIAWAQEIVFVNEDNYIGVTKIGPKYDLSSKDVFVLAVPDRFPFRDPVLLDFIRKELKDKGFPEDNAIQSIPQDPSAIEGYRGQRED